MEFTNWRFSQDSLSPNSKLPKKALLLYIQTPNLQQKRLLLHPDSTSTKRFSNIQTPNSKLLKKNYFYVQTSFQKTLHFYPNSKFHAKKKVARISKLPSFKKTLLLYPSSKLPKSRYSYISSYLLAHDLQQKVTLAQVCLLYTSPSPRD